MSKPHTYSSPSERYRLEVVNVPSEKPGYSDTSVGRVYEGERLIATVRRNYHSFQFAFVEDHPSGGDYMVCGEDYQGQTVVNLKTGEVKSYVPEAAKHGVGFCWVNAELSPDNSMLLVDGCYWACPYEVWVVDFSDPMTLPWPVLFRGGDEFKEWLPEGGCVIEKTAYYVNIPGHRLHGVCIDELKTGHDGVEDEYDAVEEYANQNGLPPGPDGEDPGWIERKELHTVKRPATLTP